MAAATFAAACSLNPQPELPGAPANADGAGRGGSQSDSGTGGISPSTGGTSTGGGDVLQGAAAGENSGGASAHIPSEGGAGGTGSAEGGAAGQGGAEASSAGAAGVTSLTLGGSP